MSDSLDMDTTKTATATEAITAAATRSGDLWRTQLGTITAKESGIGSGVLGNAFHASYQPAPTVQGTDRVIETLGQLASGGRDTVGVYRYADQRAAAGMPR